nr:hypothetical protein Iba_chr11eCG2410 [Ipomoea batatas]
MSWAVDGLEIYNPHHYKIPYSSPDFRFQLNGYIIFTITTIFRLRYTIHTTTKFPAPPQIYNPHHYKIPLLHPRFPPTRSSSCGFSVSRFVGANIEDLEELVIGSVGGA